ncbi:DEHA2C05214p [Debaryomyces hansenii CBS767]|jgi:SP family sugar:H+ symporter-like MFS transporter|uniref:DEHA2C05214p n=1 Tax=Debaryomyces hansenii (strain ATCC 36239 / CBS 767 / BCRC 21394 / JCM 1990 / NBRC 0083 / IGC 2968) TaxID=284592 RepID=Q6BV56_DEBHA|nr:DEHA2C05214p [Debaryomyces hansenii CBS767]CAG85964.1 DEHA2C05214p [Debaryomyces hansenii CBS767]|eukprot:XP_457913.1 DEHA2C05214p [Debaryomyces hansenii CBS767]
MSQEEYSSGVQTPVSNHSGLEKEEQHKLDGLDEDEIVDQLPSLPEKSAKDYLLISFFCVLVAFGGFVFGFDTGTISGFVNMSDYLERFGELNADGEYFLSNVRTGLIVAIFNVGCAVGGIFLSKIADVYGRRIGLMFSMIIYVIGIIVQISASDKWYQIVVGRAIAGLAVGTVSVLSPLFIGESAPKTLRGTLVCCFQLCITLGIFLGYCTTYGTKTYTDSRQWRIPLGLCFVWAIMLVIGMVCMPESPRYLVVKNKIEEAKKSIGRSNKVSPEDPAVYTEVQLIQAGIERESLAGSASWTELVTGKPRIFRRVIMGIMLQSLQQLTGDNYFFYYGTTIFQAVGMTDSFQTSIVLGVVNFASTFLGIYTIERFGRRLCLLTGSVCMFVCFIIYSILGVTNLYIDGYDGPTSVPTGDAMIFITTLYIFFFASTWAGGVYCIVSETYPLRIRSKAMSVATAANWIWGFLISFFTPFITSAIHFYYGFVFTGCLLFSFFYVYFFVVETKGLTLEEVDELYAQGVAPWKSSKWVPPTKEEMAHSSGYAAEAKPHDQQV